MFGHFGDRLGRKPMLVITLLLVGGGTFIIGLLPTYATIGIWAPVLLLLMRLIQGFGAGAEYGGAVIFAVEYAPPGRRGWYGSFAPMGVVVGNLLAAGVFYVVSLLPKEDLLAWGWRIPFLLSFLVLGVGLFIRMRIAETPVFETVGAERPKLRSPAIEALRRHPRNFLVVIGARLAENGLGYLFPVFGLGYMINTLRIPRETAITGVMLGNFAEIFGVMFFAWLSDHVGRRPVYMGGALFSAAFAFPFFWLTGTRDPVLIAVAFIGVMANRRRRDVRSAGGLFRRNVRPAAAVLRLCVRTRTGFDPRGWAVAVHRRAAGGLDGGRAMGRGLVRDPAGDDHRPFGVVGARDGAQRY